MELLRNLVRAELPERRKRAQADTREAQAAMEVEVEGRRADQARAAGLEKQVSISSSSRSSSRSTRPLFASSSLLSDLGRSFFFIIRNLSKIWHPVTGTRCTFYTGGIYLSGNINIVVFRIICTECIRHLYFILHWV